MSESKPRRAGAAGPESEPASEAGRDVAAETPVCRVAFCPICAAVSAASRSGPEVVQHLLLAGQQFLLALRAVVDARADDFEGRQEETRPGMERIDIG